jgi:outer membrane murein-binding lipoprotein Lpp
MFKDTEILQNLQHTQVALSTINAVITTLHQKMDALQEQVEYLAAAEEARSTHSKNQ